MKKTEFTKDDLERIAYIEADPDKTFNEKFLLSIIDKFFMRVAMLRDELERCQYDIKEGA